MAAGSSHGLDLLTMLGSTEGIGDGMSVGTEIPSLDDVSETPPAKRARVAESTHSGSPGYSSKVGIGVIGVLLASLEAVFGDMLERMRRKSCRLCKKFMCTPDPVDPTRTRAWHKPRFEGKICAYCGVAMKKLWPGKDAGDVVTLIDTKQEEQGRLTAYTDLMIAAYVRGDRAARNVGEPLKETVEKNTSFNVETSTSGKMKLLASYKEQFGDPLTNGLKHTVTTALWKDGTFQEVVLVPEDAEDEMRAKWSNTVAHAHKQVMHDGNLKESPNQLADVFAGLRGEKGASQFSGKVVHRAPTSVVASSSSSSLAAHPPPRVQLASRSKKRAIIPMKTPTRKRTMARQLGGTSWTSLVAGEQVVVRRLLVRSPRRARLRPRARRRRRGKQQLRQLHHRL